MTERPFDADAESRRAFMDAAGFGDDYCDDEPPARAAESGLDAHFAVTTFKDFAAATKHEQPWSLRTLAPRIRTITAVKKSSLPWLKLARFGDIRTDKNSLRHDGNVLAITGIEADYDAERMPVAAAVEKLEKAGILSMVYTSPSHTEDTPRWRVLCPTSTELPPDRRAKLMGRLNGLFDGIFSGESWTLSQAYYFGSVNHAPSHVVELIDGTPIDDHDELDAIWTGKPNTSIRTTPTGERVAGPADEAALLAEITTGAAYHESTTRLAGKWAFAGVPMVEARARLLAAFDEVPEATRDPRWQARRADVDRCLVGIYGKEARQKDQGKRRPEPPGAPEGGNPAGDWTGEPVPLPEDTGPGAGRQTPQPDPKRPLFRPLPPPPVFPVPALGALRSAAEAVQARTQAPMAICAQSVLAAATLAVQAHRDVELPGGGRRPLTGIFASVAESGERKTSVDRIALAPVYKIEEQWRQDHEAARASYGNDLDAWKAARDSAKKKNKGDRAAIRAALEAIGSEPKAPPQPMLLVADPTPEALVLHLRDSRPWCGVFTAEGGILIGGSAFNDESRMRTGALFNTLWDGEPIRRSRVLTGNAFLPGRRCSAHVMMQAAVADKLLGDSMLDGIGLLARVLLVAPESTAGSRMFRETPLWCASALRSYSDRLMTLLTRPPTVAADAADVLDPPAMTLTAEARALWVQFHDAAECRLGDGGELASIRAFGAKMGEHAGRLAAVLTVYADPDAMEVNAEGMTCGIALAQHYAAEMLRLQGGSTVDPDLRLAARLLAWWQARPDPRCHLAAIYQTGPRDLRDAGIVRRIVAVLEEHGWVRRLPAGTPLDGAPKRDAWELVP